MKFLKYLKYILLALIAIQLAVVIGGIIKYNIDLNRYIDQEEPEGITVGDEYLGQGTQVFVLGTNHYETDAIKRDDFYVYLYRISPSIILYESDTKTVKRMVKRTDFLRQLMSSFKDGNKVESFIALRYIKHHPGSEVLSYEWEERDAYHAKHEILTRSSDLLRAVVDLHSEGLLTSEQSVTVEEFLDLETQYYEIFRDAKKVEDINNAQTDDIIRRRQLYVYKYIPEIAKERDELKEFEAFIPIHMGYWDRRNKAMAANILKQIKRHPNKRIVVLNGYSHRYYLIDELKKYETKLNFTVK